MECTSFFGSACCGILENSKSNPSFVTTVTPVELILAWVNSGISEWTDDATIFYSDLNSRDGQRSEWDKYSVISANMVLLCESAVRLRGTFTLALQLAAVLRRHVASMTAENVKSRTNSTHPATESTHSTRILAPHGRHASCLACFAGREPLSTHSAAAEQASFFRNSCLHKCIYYIIQFLPTFYLSFMLPGHPLRLSD
jgi:hypothetical protein